VVSHFTLSPPRLSPAKVLLQSFLLDLHSVIGSAKTKGIRTLRSFCLWLAFGRYLGDDLGINFRLDFRLRLYNKRS
jgi:hypothetical protein